MSVIGFVVINADYDYGYASTPYDGDESYGKY